LVGGANREVAQRGEGETKAMRENTPQRATRKEGKERITCPRESEKIKEDAGAAPEGAFEPRPRQIG
jgi:hypothetical protein